MVLGTLVLAGCADSATGKVDEDYMKNAEATGKARREVFVKTGGDYDKLDAADKAAYLKTFNGDEANAKRFWDLMKNPPSSAAPSGVDPSKVGG